MSRDTEPEIRELPELVWAAIEHYADEVHECAIAVKIDVGIDKAGRKCLSAEADAKAAINAYAAAEVAKERERLLSLARSRADYESTNAAHHAGTWHAAYEWHMIRSSAMRELINAISTTPEPAKG